MSLFDTSVLVSVSARDLVAGDTIHSARARRSVASVKRKGAWVELRTTTAARNSWPTTQHVRANDLYVVERMEPDACA